ncbi:hypothetical protein GCM10009754_70360 [Amycolatopsis minnesotensis]|uniref:Uncharacterized protein n=2 Tax=Amycolatopsis minnesotensis TaxID=337894 RepID=A0ABN2SBI8_9PSEU
MALNLVAGCEGGDCPEIFTNDDGDVVVKGYMIGSGDRAAIRFASDEDAVVIPRSLLLRAAHGLEGP